MKKIIKNFQKNDEKNTINVTDMSYMFNECSSSKELNISKFNTNKVSDMSSMFRRCSS